MRATPNDDANRPNDRIGLLHPWVVNFKCHSNAKTIIGLPIDRNVHRFHVHVPPQKHEGRELKQPPPFQLTVYRYAATASVCGALMANAPIFT